MKRFISLFLVILFALTCSVGASAQLVGDVNSDNKANSMDALLILRHSVGFNDGTNTKYMDINGDGKINSVDALSVLMIAVGIYNGDLEVDDELVTSYKTQIIDPVIKTGKFTFTTEVEADGEVRTATAMIGSAADGEAGIQKIIDFRQGVDETCFSLKGYREIALDQIQ